MFSWKSPLWILPCLSLIITFVTRDRSENAKRTTLWSLGCFFSWLVYWWFFKPPEPTLFLCNIFTVFLFLFSIGQQFFLFYTIFVVYIGFICAFLCKNWLVFYAANEYIFFVALLFLGFLPKKRQGVQPPLLLHAVTSCMMLLSLGYIVPAFGTLEILPEVTHLTPLLGYALFMGSLLGNIPLWPFTYFWEKPFKHASLLGKFLCALGGWLLVACGQSFFHPSITLPPLATPVLYILGGCNLAYSLYCTYRKRDILLCLLFATSGSLLPYAFSLHRIVLLGFGLLWMTVILSKSTGDGRHKKTGFALMMAGRVLQCLIGMLSTVSVAKGYGVIAEVCLCIVVVAGWKNLKAPGPKVLVPLALATALNWL